MAPPPMIPTLSRSPVLSFRPPVMASSSIASLQCGSREVGREDLPKTLSSPGPAHCSPLAEPDTMARPGAVDRKVSHQLPIAVGDQSEGAAPEQLAALGPKHPADCRSVDPHLG